MAGSGSDDEEAYGGPRQTPGEGRVYSWQFFAKSGKNTDGSDGPVEGLANTKLGQYEALLLFLRRADNLLRASAERRVIFPDGYQIFVDLPWEILLEVFSAQIRGEAISARQFARKLEINPDLAQRWSAILCERDIVYYADGKTGLDSPVALTDSGFQATCRSLIWYGN